MLKVSVLMPIYNTNEQHLREAIESVLRQTFDDFEFLILNKYKKICPHLFSYYRDFMKGLLKDE